MDTKKIIDQIAAWFDEDPTHTSVFVICTTKDEADEAPIVTSYADGNKNDTLQALAVMAYEMPEVEEFLTRALTAAKLLRQQEDAQADAMHHTSGKEAHHAS